MSYNDGKFYYPTVFFSYYQIARAGCLVNACKGWFCININIKIPGSTTSVPVFFIVKST